MVLVPLATSASVVSVCSTLRLAERAGVERVAFVGEHVEPSMETNWHSEADVDAVDPRALRAVPPCKATALACYRN